MDIRIPTLFDDVFFGPEPKEEEHPAGQQDQKHNREAEAGVNAAAIPLPDTTDPKAKEEVGGAAEMLDPAHSAESAPKAGGAAEKNIGAGRHASQQKEHLAMMSAPKWESSAIGDTAKTRGDISLELPSMPMPFVIDKVVEPEATVAPNIAGPSADDYIASISKPEIELPSSQVASEDTNLQPLKGQELKGAAIGIGDKTSIVVGLDREVAEPAIAEREGKDDGAAAEAGLIALPPMDLAKQYYGIGEVAKMFDANISHIRFWTTEFKLKPRTTRKGDRLYNHSDIEQLRMIHYLVKEKKYTIKGARAKLKNEKRDVVGNITLLEQLRALRTKLAALHDNL